MDHLSSLTSIINASDGITLAAAGDRYIEYMNYSGKYRPNTIIKYTEYIHVVSGIIGGTKKVANLTKQDAVHLRDTLIKQNKGTTTIFHVFSIFRSFLRWLNKEGIISSSFWNRIKHLNICEGQIEIFNVIETTDKPRRTAR